MNQKQFTSLFAGISVALFLLAYLACGRDAQQQSGPRLRSRPIPENAAAGGPLIDLPQGEPKAGTAVVILVDTSGSMNQDVRDQGGQRRPKHAIARDAIERIIQYTGKWKRAHPDRVLHLGIYHFSSSVAPVLPMGDFDQARAEAALKRLPRPNSGTAIGRGLEEGFKALYQSGCLRKYLVCITDGENTSGTPPDVIARQLYAQTKGEVEMHFVAFDIAASRFSFLSAVNGRVVEAADGEQLQVELTKIYEKRILAEAEEPEPKK